MVSTQPNLKNIRQNGNLPQIKRNMKNIGNHDLEIMLKDTIPIYTPKIQHRYQQLPCLKGITFSQTHHFGALQPLVFGGCTLHVFVFPSTTETAKWHVLQAKLTHFPTQIQHFLLLHIQPTTRLEFCHKNRRTSSRCEDTNDGNGISSTHE